MKAKIPANAQETKPRLPVWEFSVLLVLMISVFVFAAHGVKPAISIASSYEPYHRERAHQDPYGVHVRTSWQNETRHGIETGL